MTKKKCFLSFHYKDDNWRVSQVKNIGAIDEQPLLSANKWEEIENQGDDAVRDWIDRNMRGKDCLVVLIGSKTASRRWVKHEIKKAWGKGIGVLGIHVHNLKDKDGNQSAKGADPFGGLTVDGESIVAKVYDPPYKISTNVYEHIASNIGAWVDAAIEARS
ncbi:TIR domain-containing protein [Aurantiacibacter flavus]|uniref:TIR domain-containing protein n=1 Tax=Aurantiacibacter flavus TaxID=3145232 RepID=A0ABV0D186_9SPHN